MIRRPSRVRLLRWLLPTVIVLGDLCLAASVFAQVDHKRVLVLYSTRRDAEFSTISEGELPRTLDIGLGGNFDYYSEFIDVARFPDPAKQVAFGDFLRLKYQGVRFDVVIAMGDVATQFVTGNREPLFGDTPLVYFANDRSTQGGANSTGVIVERNFAATLELVKTLQPEVTKVFVVTGAAAADKAFENLLRTQAKALESRLDFTYLAGLPTGELERRLGELPPQSIVYYVLLTEDGDGNKFHPLDYVERVATAANAPTYSWVDSTMGRGVVGGSLYIQRDAAVRVGQLALRVLRGEPPESIPVASLDLNAIYIDWRQLRRWNIDDARVPAGTVIRFREPSIWDRYRVYILGAIGLLLLQSALIAGLLVQHARRQRAERELRVSQAALRTSYERIRDMGGRLLSAQETERSRIARELHDDISQQLSILAIDLSLIRRQVQGPANDLTQEALNLAQGIVKSVHDLSHRLHPAKLRLIGLVAALRELQRELSRAEVPITFTDDSVPEILPHDLTLCLFRLVQEGLQNAIKYSQARRISVHLGVSSGELRLTIEDDGVGFDVNSAWGKGLGLISMSERVEAIGGNFNIRSETGEGTRIEAAVPLHVVEDRNTVAV